MAGVGGAGAGGVGASAGRSWRGVVGADIGIGMAIGAGGGAGAFATCDGFRLGFHEKPGDAPPESVAATLGAFAAYDITHVYADAQALALRGLAAEPLLAGAQARESGMIERARVREEIGGNVQLAWEALRDEAAACTR